jgi:hypothetical protein
MFLGFAQSLQANGGIVSPITLQPPPSTSVPVHYSLIILALDADGRKTASINNKLQIK